MRLTDYLLPQFVKVPLTARDKRGVIEELVDALMASGLAASRETLLKAVLDREAQRTTGIGRGFAVPHAKCDTVSRMVIALGLAPGGVEFGSIDHQPVRLIALLASPLHAAGMQIQALAKLSRLVLDGSVLAEMLAAKTSEELYAIIVRNDVEV